MLATVMNCIYVSEILRTLGMKTGIYTQFEIGSVTEVFHMDTVNEALSEGKVVFLAGGTGHPYFSTDTATALRAIEIEAEGILLAKAVDGIYDSDPKVNPDAKRYDKISIQEVVDQQLAVMDLTASIMCMENKMPMYVFALNEQDSIVKAISGSFNGTIVTA
jgi:uridylate kinase